MDTVIRIGDPAPLFTLDDLTGQARSLEQYSGQVVVLYFWSAECDWCERVDEEVIHSLEAWDEQVKVLWVASNANESRALVESTALQRKIPAVLVDKDLSVADKYGAQTTPHFFVVDTGGKIRYQGAWDDITFRQRQATQAYVQEVVEALINKHEPPVTTTPAYGCTLVRHPG